MNACCVALKAQTGPLYLGLYPFATCPSCGMHGALMSARTSLNSRRSVASRSAYESRFSTKERAKADYHRENMKEFLFQVARHPQKFEDHIAKRRKQSQQSDEESEESEESEEREAQHHDLCEVHVLHEKCAKVRQVSLSETDEIFYIKDEDQKDEEDEKDEKDVSSKDGQGLKLEMCGKREIVSL